MSDITTEQFMSISERDRQFFLMHRDDIKMCVINGNLYYTWNNKPYVTWERFQTLLKLQDSLTKLDEYEILLIYTDFNDWNHYGRPYADYGFYYNLNIIASSYNFDRLGIKQGVKDWFTDWLLGRGFRADEVATVFCGGCTRHYEKDGSYSEIKKYGIEIRCRFFDIPAQWLPEKVHRWAKHHPEYHHLIFGK